MCSMGSPVWVHGCMLGMNFGTGQRAPVSPDAERVVRELEEEEEAEARQRYEEIISFLEKRSRSTSDKAQL